jgi:glycerophosphoryl diester phosphodiesterase
LISRFGKAIACLGSAIACLTSPAAVASAESQGFDLQGHRGARGLHPESSLEGFREALAIGVTTLEMDVGTTRDGVLVVHHDEQLHPEIARGPDGQWLVSPTPALVELSWEELATHDIGRLQPGSAYARRFPDQRGREGVRVPRFADVMAEAERQSGGRIHYNVETKLSPDAPERSIGPVKLADALLRELREAGVEARTTLQSFDWRSLRHVQKVAPGVPTVCLTSEYADDDTIQRGKPGASPWTAGLDVDDFGGSVPRLVKAAGCDIWSPDFAHLDAASLALAHELGLRVIPWTVNEPSDIQAVLALGVDGVISDRPDRVRKAMARRGMPLPTAYPLAGAK